MHGICLVSPILSTDWLRFTNPFMFASFIMAIALALGLGQQQLKVPASEQNQKECHVACCCRGLEMCSNSPLWSLMYWTTAFGSTWTGRQVGSWLGCGKQTCLQEMGLQHLRELPMFVWPSRPVLLWPWLQYGRSSCKIFLQSLLLASNFWRR